MMPTRCLCWQLPGWQQGVHALWCRCVGDGSVTARLAHEGNLVQAVLGGLGHHPGDDAVLHLAIDAKLDLGQLPSAWPALSILASRAASSTS